MEIVEEVLVVNAPEFDSYEEFLEWFDNLKSEDYKPYYPS